MSSCLIAYFSQGGTATRVAEAIASGLRRTGWTVDLAKIDRNPPGDLSRYELIGIGSPVHYFRPPFLVSDYLRRLPRLDGRAAFTFVLHGTYRGDAGNTVRRALVGKGARDVGYFHARGADRFLGYMKLGYLFSHDHPTYDEIVQAEAFGGEVAQRAAGAPFVSAEMDRRPSVIYRLERFLVNRWLIRNIHSRLFRVDAGRCTACDVCMKLCPAGNLRPGGGGRPVWGRECLLCLACEAGCPKEAIASPVTSRLFRPFLRYNIHVAAEDPSLDHTRVSHRKGRTERIGR
jgi:flavodoxin/Pyruvate/2-oxoacid:ferredoxin oxidoreductase delta subunit